MQRQKYELEIIISEEVLNSGKINIPIKRKINSSRHYRSTSLSLNTNNLNFTNFRGSKKMTSSSQSDLEKEISSLKVKCRREEALRHSYEGIANQLQQKIKILNSKENKSQAQLKNEMDSNKEAQKIQESKKQDKLVLLNSKKEKDRRQQETKRRVQYNRITLQKNLVLTKQRFFSQKEKNGKKIFDERKKNEESIKNEKDRESSLKKENCKLVKGFLNDGFKKKIRENIRKQLLMKQNLENELKRHELCNKKLGRIINDYRQKAFNIVNKINNIPIFI